MSEITTFGEYLIAVGMIAFGLFCIVFAVAVAIYLAYYIFDV